MRFDSPDSANRVWGRPDGKHFTKLAQSNAAEGAAKLLKQNSVAMVSSGKNFFQFGHGMYASYGHFVAAAKTRLMTAFMVLDYDITSPLVVVATTA